MSGAHDFTVSVDTATLERAQRVMAERLGHDEDYGFPYTLDWRPGGAPVSLVLERSDAMYEDGTVSTRWPESASIAPLGWVQATYGTLRIPHRNEVLAFLDDANAWVLNTKATVPWMTGLVERFGTAPFSDFIVCTFAYGDARVKVDAACDCDHCAAANPTPPPDAVLTRDVAIAYMTGENLGTPGCDFGDTEAQCAPTAYALALLYADASGELTHETLDSAMGAVVCDQPGILDALRDGTHAFDDETAEHVRGLLERST